jgi:hypothetical protein
VTQPDDPKSTLHDLRTAARDLADDADSGAGTLRRGLRIGALGLLVLVAIGVAFAITVSLHTAAEVGGEAGDAAVAGARSQRASDDRTDLAYWDSLLADRGLSVVQAPGPSASADQVVEAAAAAQAQVLWADMVAARGAPVPGYIAPSGVAPPAPTPVTTTPGAPDSSSAPAGPTVVPGPSVGGGGATGGGTSSNGGAVGGGANGAAGTPGATGPTGATGKTGSAGQAGAAPVQPAPAPAPLIKLPTITLPGVLG